MSETPQEWIAYLRELADAQTVKQIAVNIRQAADCFERNLVSAPIDERDDPLRCRHQWIGIDHMMWKCALCGVIRDHA